MGCIRIIIKFMGLLANVDSSISSILLDNGYKIGSMKMKELIEFLNIIEDRREPYYIAEELLQIYPNYKTPDEISKTDNKVFFIENSLEITGNWTQSSNNMVELYSFHEKNYETYLFNALNLIRLFKEGNICIPYYFYYSGDYNNPKVINRPEKIPIHSKEEYSLKTGEIKNLTNFLCRDWHLNFKELKIAFECYNLSYEINKIHLQFLTLIAGLESLFIADSEEKITKTVSRNTAILIGDKKTGEKIYNNMIELYGMRHGIAHRGEQDIKKDKLLLLREYLRESIKEMDNIISVKPSLYGPNGRITLDKFSKDKGNFKHDISYLFYTCGFGDKPWMK